MGGFFQPANSQQVVGYLTIFRVLSKARIIIFCGNETTHYQSGKIKKTTKGRNTTTEGSEDDKCDGADWHK